MTNRDKISFAINQIPINNCDSSANENAIKAVRYLQEVHHSLLNKSATYKPPPEFFEWLDSHGRLNLYEAVLDMSEDYGGDQATRLKASEDLENFYTEFKNLIY